ncbi:MAG: hydrogenase nickel incorporation protein HypB [Phycisphaerae bacterium]|nr:hydrogenase nickel incorporation protein HypB [Phycisphaerae bacterium]
MEIQVLRNVFERNDALAEVTRRMFDEAGVVCLNMIGSAGAGKTSLLEAALPVLTEDLRVAVLEGDIATANDAERIARLDVPVMQLTTEGGCHLSAALVHEAVKRLDLDRLDAVIVENVGNLVCPAAFDIGEHQRIAVLSFAEGDDKPAKYPKLFKTSDLVVLSKCDMADLCDFDAARAEGFVRQVNTEAPVMVVSSRTGQNMDAFVSWMRGRIGATAVSGSPR